MGVRSRGRGSIFDVGVGFCETATADLRHSQWSKEAIKLLVTNHLKEGFHYKCDFNLLVSTRYKDMFF